MHGDGIGKRAVRGAELAAAALTFILVIDARGQRRTADSPRHERPAPGPPHVVAAPEAAVLTGRVRVVGECQPPFTERRQHARVEARAESAIDREADRRPPLRAEGVRVRRLAGTVGRDMIDVIAISVRQARVGAGVRSNAHPGAHHRVAVRVVVRVQTVRLEPGPPQRVGDAGPTATHIDGAVGRPVGARAQLSTDPRPPLPRAREDLDHAGHRIRPVQHAAGSAHDLDPIHIVGRERCEIQAAARTIQRHAVQQDLRVIALAPAQKQRRLAAEASRLDHGRAGDAPQGLPDRADALRPQVFPAQHRDRSGHDVHRHGEPCSGDDDRLQGDGVLDDEGENEQRGVHAGSSFDWRRGIIWGRPSRTWMATGHEKTRSMVSRVSTFAGAPAPAGRPSARSRTESA